METILKRKKEPAPVIKMLLVFGILSSLLYVGTDILASLQYVGYSYLNQVFSELQATGAPTRQFVVVMMSVYNALTVLFAIGIMMADKRKRAFMTGLMLIVYAVSGEATTLFFAMNMRGVPATYNDTAHQILTIVFVVCMLLYIVFSFRLFDGKFFHYSIATIAVVVLFGTLAGLYGPRLAANEPTPWIGIMERVNIYACLAWIIVLAIKSLRLRRSVLEGKPQFG